MERLEAIIKKYIPEAVTWKVITKTSVVIKNTDNNILDGLYENWFISYVDSYEAVFYEYLSFKNGDFFGIKSKYRKMLKVDDHFAIKNEDIDIYQFGEKYKDEDQRTAMVFEILQSHKLNKNKSIRDYVTIKEEFYDEGIESPESFSERDILIKIYDCVSENNKLLKDYLKSPKRMNADDKIFFRSIELLVELMIEENSSEERKGTADKICELLEDYIADIK